MRARVMLVVVLGMLAASCGFGGPDEERQPDATASTAGPAATATMERGGLRAGIARFVETTYVPFPLDDGVAVVELRARDQTLERRLELRQPTSQSQLALRERLPQAAQRYVCGQDFPRAVVAAGGEVTDTYYRASGEAIGSMTVAAEDCGQGALPPAADSAGTAPVFDADRVSPRERGEALVDMANANAPRALSGVLTFQGARLEGNRLVRRFRVEPTSDRIDGNVQALLNQDLCTSTPYRRFLDAGGVIRHRYEGERGGRTKAYNVTADHCRHVELATDDGEAWQRARYQTGRAIIRDLGLGRYARYLEVIGAPRGLGAIARTRAIGVDDGALIQELAIGSAFIPMGRSTRQGLEGRICQSGYLRAVVGAGGDVRQIYYDPEGRRIGSHRVSASGCAAERGD